MLAEKLCKSGDRRMGVKFFLTALQVGTDNKKTLSAIYSQLGNAYFYLQTYDKALEYHTLDLNLARLVYVPAIGLTWMVMTKVTI